MLGDLLGVPFRHETADRRDALLSLDGAEVVVADAILADGPRLPGTPLPRWPVADELPEAAVCGPELPVLGGGGPLLERRGSGYRLGIDVFGAAFLLLSRYEELVVAERDAAGRFPAYASLAVREGFLHRPLADEYAEVLWAVLARVWPRLERRPREFRVVPTHGVARLPRRGPARELASSAADLVRRRDPALAAHRARFALGGPDPEANVDLAMDLAERRGLRATVYVTAGEDELARRVGARGHELGVLVAEDPAAELEALRAVVRQDAWGGRRRSLAGEAWRSFADAGLTHDSSLGFVEAPGFRCGTCREYGAFDLRARRPLPVRERPLVATDEAALRYLRLDRDAALAQLSTLKDACRRVGGDFVLGWRTAALAGRAGRLLYERVLDA